MHTIFQRAWWRFPGLGDCSVGWFLKLTEWVNSLDYQPENVNHVFQSEEVKVDKFVMDAWFSLLGLKKK